MLEHCNPKELLHWIGELDPALYHRVMISPGVREKPREVDLGYPRCFHRSSLDEISEIHNGGTRSIQ